MDLGSGLQDITAFFYMQGFGLIALMIAVVRLQVCDLRTAILLNIFICLFFAVQNFMLGAIAGAILPFSSGLRSLLSLMPMTSRGRFVIVPLTLLSGTVLAFMFRESELALLVLVGPYLIAYGELSGSPYLMRLSSIVCDGIWIVYNVANGAVGATISGMVCISSGLMGIARHDLPQMPVYQRVFVKT